MSAEIFVTERRHHARELTEAAVARGTDIVIAWGGDPRDLEWFETPPRQALDAAIVLLERLGAVRSKRLTDLGRRLQALPIHPRLARMLIAADGATTMARACALHPRLESPAQRQALAFGTVKPGVEYIALAGHLCQLGIQPAAAREPGDEVA